jgi:hypothetical protein
MYLEETGRGRCGGVATLVLSHDFLREEGREKRSRDEFEPGEIASRSHAQLFHTDPTEVRAGRREIASRDRTRKIKPKRRQIASRTHPSSLTPSNTKTQASRGG